jgi:hypothetical protein
MLPILRTGEAIIVGEAVHLPVRTALDPPSKDRRPDSSDPLVFDDQRPGGWNRPREKADYSDVVRAWRKQDPRSPRGAKKGKKGAPMERVPVTSSTIVSVGYDAATGTLEVEFKSGDVYQYFDVPPRVHEEFMAAQSQGKFLHQHIKGRYRYSKL